MKLSDQQLSWNISLQAVMKRKTVYKKVTRSINHQSRENKKYFGASDGPN
jgi:hypothetical protein